LAWSCEISEYIFFVVGFLWVRAIEFLLSHSVTSTVTRLTNTTMAQPAKFWERIFSTAQPPEPSESRDDTERTDDDPPLKPKNPATLRSELELILWSRKTALQAEELRQLLKTACTHLYDQGELLQQYKGEVLALRKLVEDLGATVASTNAAHNAEGSSS
jgi:hypothetical protein